MIVHKIFQYRKFQVGMLDELKSIQNNDVWKLFNLPEGFKTGIGKEKVLIYRNISHVS